MLHAIPYDSENTYLFPNVLIGNLSLFFNFRPLMKAFRGDEKEELGRGPGRDDD